MRLAVLLAFLSGTYGFVAGIAVGVASAETGLIGLDVSLFGTQWTLVVGAGVVIVATALTAYEVSDALTILRQQYEEAYIDD